MSDKTFDNVTLNIKWKKNDTTVRPDIWPDTGQDANGYLNTNITSTIGLVARYIDDLGTAAFSDITNAVTANGDIPTNAAIKTYVDNTTICEDDELYVTCVPCIEDIGDVVHYGVRIAKNNSDPASRVQYMYDAIGFTPAHMVYDDNDPENSHFSYGSWQDAFFMRNNYPCMCRYDGIEDYRLDPDNHFIKEDGTRSDVDNLSYAGNAQSCFGCHIWLWAHEDADYEYYEISNVQYNPNFHLNAYIRADGSIADSVYFPMYKGSLDSTGRLRSMSSALDGSNDVYPQNKTTTDNEVAACNKNGNNWQICDWAHRELLNALLIIIGKNDDTQLVFGQGCTSGGADNASIHYGFPKNGSLNMKGQFYGYDGTTNAMKVFFIENWWGTRWDRCLGLINNRGTIYVKWTPPYSSTSVSDHINTGMTVPVSGGSYMKKTSNTYGRLPVSVGGSATTYTCDYFYAVSNQLCLALCGGYAGVVAGAGAWCVYLSGAPSLSHWGIGASPYLK